MSQPPSKSERMEIRRQTGNRIVRPVAVPAGPRGPARLWPHACFDCCKSWKLPESSTARCPQCGAGLHWMGRAFKAPKKSDREQWAKVQALWIAGYRFMNHTGWRAVEPYPERLREVPEFIQRNPDHPFRHER